MKYLTPGYRRMNENDWPDHWGHLFTPAEFVPIVEDGRIWAVDNGVFTRGFVWDDMKAFLERKERHRKTCKFVVVPDVVGNALATMDAFRWWAWRIKDMGWPVAFVGQDGQEQYDFPPEYDALFIGGTTEWKMGKGAERCIAQAQERGKWVHIGRVNTGKRIRHFALLGVDSVDGTALVYGPEKNKRWIEKALLQEPLSGFILER